MNVNTHWLFNQSYTTGVVYIPYCKCMERGKERRRKEHGCMPSLSSAGTDFRDPVFPHAEAFLTMKTTKVNWVKK